MEEKYRKGECCAVGREDILKMEGGTGKGRDGGREREGERWRVEALLWHFQTLLRGEKMRLPDWVVSSIPEFRLCGGGR